MAYYCYIKQREEGVGKGMVGGSTNRQKDGKRDGSTISRISKTKAVDL